MDSRYFHVIEKIKKIKGLGSVAKVAKELGMSRNNLYNYEKRQTLPMKALHSFCVREGISLDSLLYVPSLESEEVSPEGNELRKKYPEHAELFENLETIIQSGDDGVIEAIKNNLKEFSLSVKKNREIDELKAQMQEVHEFMDELRGRKEGKETEEGKGALSKA